MLTFRIAAALLTLLTVGVAQGADTFTQRIESIMSRPEYRHAMFGIEVYSLDSQQVLFEVNGNKLFTPGSTTKLLSVGTALELLGANYRFHTFVYRTGPIDSNGTLQGDLVLLASGDPDLSNRIQPDNTLAFENEDHSYGGSVNTKAVPGDPLKVIREFADQIAAKGIKEVTGRVLVDTSLFPEGERELGTGVVISPIIVNDNVIDVTIGPGASDGAPGTMTVSPQLDYIHFVNKVTTSSSATKVQLEEPDTEVTPDGTYTVTVTGSAHLGDGPILYAYPVNQPSRFAEFALVEALRDKGIKAQVPHWGDKVDFDQYTQSYKPENVVAEHVSPPFSEEAKVTLKVSQNLHASAMPFIVGAILGKAKTHIEQAGFDQEHAFLDKGGLDLSGASQSDGAGGSAAAFFTPDFMVHYLAYMAKQNDAAVFQKALPILGRDGSLFDIQTDSPAAGHVFAKTGTYVAPDRLNRDLMLTGKGLAGYTTTPSGQHLAFALYVNHVALPRDYPDAAAQIPGQALGEIAAAAYLMPINAQTLSAGR